MMIYNGRINAKRTNCQYCLDRRIENIARIRIYRNAETSGKLSYYLMNKFLKGQGPHKSISS